MVSSVDTAKRVLVTLLKSLAGIYSVVLSLTRESTEVEVRAAYKKVSRKAHPDQGGAPEHQKALNAARGAWEGRGERRAEERRGEERSEEREKGRARRERKRGMDI